MACIKSSKEKHKIIIIILKQSYEINKKNDKYIYKQLEIASKYMYNEQHCIHIMY